MNFRMWLEQQDISIDIEEGSIDGIIHHNREFLYNWLLNQVRVETDYFDKITDNNLLPIAILKNMWVEEESRNQGIGTMLVKDFIQKAKLNNAKNIILESDEGEVQNLDLTKWYESFGFKRLPVDSTYPLMILSI